jgi:preprotein translocase subunit SecG
MTAIVVFIQFILSIGLITLILLHSGRDAGMGGMGFVPTSQGGTHIVEKNLTRLTVAFTVAFFINTIFLYRVL